jgi:hypothetical protein
LNLGSWSLRLRGLLFFFFVEKERVGLGNIWARSDYCVVGVVDSLFSFLVSGQFFETSKCLCLCVLRCFPTILTCCTPLRNWRSGSTSSSDSCSLQTHFSWMSSAKDVSPCKSPTWYGIGKWNHVVTSLLAKSIASISPQMMWVEMQIHWVIVRAFTTVFSLSSLF